MIREDDPPEVKEKFEQEYEKYSVENVEATATEPKFKFYLYNDHGDLVQEHLSLHDIQHLLLRQTRQNLPSWRTKNVSPSTSHHKNKKKSP